MFFIFIKISCAKLCYTFLHCYSDDLLSALLKNKKLKNPPLGNFQKSEINKSWNFDICDTPSERQEVYLNALQLNCNSCSVALSFFKNYLVFFQR